jgi:chromosome segregation ATPase
MKSLRFEKLELLSTKEERAREIKFHPRLTVFNGTNDVGKSSVIKSIYWAFGANPRSIHRKWRDANVRALLTFTVDGIRHSIMRSGGTFAIFNATGDLLLSTSSVTKELAPFLAELLNFRLVLASRQNEAEIPPPAYAFLPFYVNQEGSWEKPFAAFDALTQYANFREAVIDFHSGILGNDFYELEAEKKKIKFDLDDLSRDRRAVVKAVEKLGLNAFTGLELSVEEHEAAVERLLSHLRRLKERRQERAAKLAHIVDLRTALESQVKIAKLAVAELEKDARYAAGLEAEVYCPVCNTRHENDFANRYGILDDREACLEFISTQNETIRGLANEVRTAEQDIRAADKVIEDVQADLAEKRGEVTLGDVIRSEGQRAAADVFQQQIGEIDERVGEMSARMDSIAKDQKALKDPARRERIETFYAQRMTSFLRELDVLNYDQDALSKINGRIDETGSDQPRAVLAYDLAFLHAIHEFGNSFTAPMVIDSPNQQDQDEVNVAAMVKLIVENIPEAGQTILGSVSLHGVSPGDAEVYEFTEKLSVLRAAEFEAVSERMAPLIQKTI